MTSLKHLLPPVLLVLVLASIAVDLYITGGQRRPLFGLAGTVPNSPSSTANTAATFPTVVDSSPSSLATDPRIKPSFDCAKASTPVEYLICRERDLADLETRMAKAYFQLRSRSGMRAEHATWFNEYTKACNSAPSEADMKDCVSSRLNGRLDTLERLLRTDGNQSGTGETLGEPAAVGAAPPASTTGATTSLPTSEGASARLGSLTVRTIAGSTMRLDGTNVGTTNDDGILHLSTLQPGRHVLLVHKDGYRAIEQTITVAPGRADVIDIPLSMLSGAISATANVAGAVFELDGNGLRLEKVSNLEMTTGIHRLIATKPGYRPASMDVNVQPGETSIVTLTLQPLPVAESPPRPRASTSLFDFERDIESGQTVNFPIKYNYYFEEHGSSIGFVETFITISKSTVGFKVTEGYKRSFTISPDKILELEHQQSRIRLRVKIAIKNDRGKEEKKDYYFYNARTQQQGQDGYGRPLISCRGCDESLNVLYGLLNKIRASKD
jgi:uncharacterized protein